MRQATRDFACGKTGEALAAYSDAGMVHAAQTRAEARAALIDRWDAERRADPAVSRMILTHLNKEVQMLKQAGRERLEIGRAECRDRVCQSVSIWVGRVCFKKNR